LTKEGICSAQRMGRPVVIFRCAPILISGCFSDILFRSGKDSEKLVNAEMAVIAFLSAANSIPSLMFFEAPKSSAVMIKNLSWSYGTITDEVFLTEVQALTRKILNKQLVVNFMICVFTLNLF